MTAVDSNILFYKLKNNNAELWINTGQIINYSYQNSSACLYDLRNMQNDLFFQTATLSDSEGNSYLINLDNTTDYYLENSNLHINFVNGYELNIACVSSEQSVRDFQYISNLDYNLKIDEKIQTRNKVYIGAEFTNDISKREFTTFANALSYINSGDILIFSEGLYEESITLDIPNVDIYAVNDNVIFKSNLHSVIQLSGINRVFGKGVYWQSTLSTAELKQAIYFDGENNEFSFVSATRLISNAMRCIVPDKNKCFAKIYEMVTTGQSYANIDCDTNGAYFDLDCFKMTAIAGNFFLVIFEETEMYLRGIKCEINSASGNLWFTYQEHLYLNMINCFFSNTKVSNDPVENGNIYKDSLGYSYGFTINLTNCYFANANNFYHFISNQQEDLTINLKCYSNIYTPKTYGGNVVKTGTGEIVIENDIYSDL